MDDLWERAANDYVDALDNTFSLGEASAQHIFSKRFSRRMKHLISKISHPVRTGILRAAVCFLAFILLIFDSMMVIDADAREEVLGWLETQRVRVVHFFFRGASSAEENLSYCLQWVPDEYELLNCNMEENGQTTLYANENGDLLKFTYLLSYDNTDIFMFSDGYDTESVMVNEFVGEMFVPHSEKEGVELVWIGENNTLFLLSGKCDKATMLRIANGILKNDQF